MGTHRDTLVVATTNRGKLEELRSLLQDLPLEVRSAAEVLREPPVVVEDGATFAENAVKKANAVARATMMLTLADDSGLEVAALDGRPGVRSARFAHERATDAENNAALLGALDAIGDPPDAQGHRAAFRCVLALVDPYTGNGEPRLVEGACEGTITRTPRGSGGFGYDPLFVVGDTERTMAELGEEEKNRVSHRGRAFAALRPVLEKVLGERAAQLARV
ncbi:MAG TPA: RdgB/HAM1 family non-canonical purine NTP pyrophosphatase [Polyangiaceae bacterium]|jgi:XTP/dITP diphosphohydrolase